MRIKLKPVYSKLADFIPPEIKLPDGWRLSQHQVETYHALTSGDYDVVFNTAMTGDGKSLAAFLRALQKNGDHAIAMYPTNELIEDQASKMPTYLRDWHSSAKYDTMFGAKITELMLETETTNRVEQMRKLLARNHVLLTNPDLFHLAMNFKLGWKWERKELPFELPANFDYFIFDEFHTFGTPQVIDVVNVINYLTVNYRHQPNNRKQFLFLSATPHPLMQELLTHSQLRVAVIEGNYQTTGGEGWRRILQSCEIELNEVSREQPIETWIKSRLAEIVQFYRDYPESKGAIIVNSVATAKRLLNWLKQNLPADLTVGENTGLTSKAERRLSFGKSLMVCTSTVDVGVDFRINLLIFEATSAGTFIQRFGRLGRHDGFGSYRAYALLPKFILERLEKSLAEQTEIERQTFNQALHEAYPNEQDFRNYASKWGVLQTAHLVAQAKQVLPKETPFISELITQYNQVFQRKDFDNMIKWYYGMVSERIDDRNKTDKKPEQLILNELTSFRGQSPLSCGLWDLTDNQFKTYDLFFLLANTDFEVMDSAEFMAQVRRRELAEREFSHQLLYVKVHGYIPEYENFLLGFKKDVIEHPEYLHQMQVFKTFYIKESRQTWIDQVNKALSKLQLVCVMSDIPAKELKRRLNLPLLFPVHRLSDLYGSEYSVAFGKNALLLESLLFFRRTSTDNPIIC